MRHRLCEGCGDWPAVKNYARFIDIGNGPASDNIIFARIATEVRAAFQVITEIGVNIVETAEFVIFRIAQWSGGRRITE